MRTKMVWALAVWLAAGGAFGGTALMDFIAGPGLLTYPAGGSGTIVANCGRASVTGASNTLLAQTGTPVSSGGTVSVTMTLQPSVDAVHGLGIIMADASDGGVTVTAICDGSGNVVLTDWIGNYQSVAFSYPAATNNYMTLQYDSTTGRATLTLNGGSSVYIYDALFGAVSVVMGVTAGGTGGFANLTAVGPSVPNYAQQDNDGDSISNDDETAAGTSASDPGHRPVVNAYGATITALNGTVVTIPPNSLPSCLMNVRVATAASIPAGSIPGGRIASDVAVALEPDGTSFSNPVHVTIPYSDSGIQDVDESTLNVFYYDGANYVATGISNVAVNAAQNRIGFDTTHFSVFLLAGTARDTDGDGIDDLWEDHWFGNDDGIVDPSDLTEADETTNHDTDEYSDLEEFELRGLGLDPWVADGSVPAAGASALALLATAIVLAYRRRQTTTE